MTQAQLAAALERHQPFVVAIERNQRRVDLVELMDIAVVLDLDVPALVKRLAETAPD
jgi:transcriptional regulator with XRE-family HTH domain